MAGGCLSWQCLTHPEDKGYSGRYFNVPDSEGSDNLAQMLCDINSP
jgi:hypothetical protein